MTPRCLALLLPVVLLCPAPPVHAADAPPAATSSTADAASPEAMFGRLSALADTGNADVLYNLGMFYNNGIGTQRDNQAAFRLFTRAAQGGNLLAAFKVGCYYAGQFKGIVVTDPKLAFDYELRAAEGGYDLAQNAVANQLYRQGRFAEALAWWEKASRQGDAASTNYLAYYLSRADDGDKAKAVALMRILKTQMAHASETLAAKMAAMEATLSGDQEREAKRIEASWMTGPTPLTLTARAGMATVPGLLRTFDR